MFTESAELYDAIYFMFKDYAAEASEIAGLIRAEVPKARTVLDVACGTGEHARRLSASGFAVDGIDLEQKFVALAKQKVPAGTFTQANMIDFTLGKTYDAVICLFSSVGYVETLPRLEQTLRSFKRHMATGGVVLVEPWFPPGTLQEGHLSTRTVEVGGAKVTRTSSTVIEAKVSRLRFDYSIEEGGRTRTASELHVLGLFTREEMLAAFTAAGLSARYRDKTVGGRGMYVARLA